ncbi:MAG: hypothetical protein GY853_03675 [PVC group bacterium]|nr:hypothetical protein [PVC group bacterium]
MLHKQSVLTYLRHSQQSFSIFWDCSALNLKCWSRIIIFALVFILLLSTLVRGQFSDKEYGSSNGKRKPILREDQIPVKDGVSYSAFEETSVSKSRESEGVRTTISGLLDAGYDLEEVVVLLEKQGHSAASISIVCLDPQFKLDAKQIHSALHKAGFSKQEADGAVPVSLRQAKQLFYQPAKNNSKSVIAEKSLESQAVESLQVSAPAVKPLINSETELKSTINTLKRSRVSTPQIVEVLKELGVSSDSIVKAFDEIQSGSSTDGFNGLGEWKSFQNARYDNVKSEAAIIASDIELVSSLRASGYTTKDIVQSIMSRPKNKNISDSSNLIRKMVKILCKSEINLEDTVNTLKDNGVSSETIIIAFMGKPVSLIDKIKSGMLFSNNTTKTANKIIKGVVNGVTLKTVIKDLQHSGHKNKDIVSALDFLQVSGVQTSEIFNQTARR